MTMNLLGEAIWGFFATLVLTTILDAGRALGITRMDIPFVFGTLFTSHRDRAKWLGFLLHLFTGWILAFFYLAAIHYSGIHHWWFGMLIGLVHACFVLLVATEVLPVVHPRMASEEHGPDPTRQLEPPGAFGLNYGRNTPIVTILAHLIYGGMLGFFYH